MACPEGLEPPTCCLEGSCSIQLSYGQKRQDGPPQRRPRHLTVPESADRIAGPWAGQQRSVRIVPELETGPGLRSAH